MTPKKHFYWKTLKSTCEEFSKNSSLTCYKYLSSPSFIERFIWWTVHLASTVAVIYLVQHSWNEFMRNPTVTSLESLTYPITNVPFPGISICNINKISRRKATEFSKELSLKSGVDEEIIFNYTLLFGNLYDYNSVVRDEERLIKFQNILETYDLNNTTEGFDLYARLKQLMIPCSDFISDCSWAGTQRKCEDIFIMGSTMEGFCCIFNYAPLKKSPQIISKIIKENNYKELLTPDSGITMGLSLIIKNEPDDYLYPLISTIGANVHIFNPNDFPDTTSGGLIEKLVPIGNEVFIRLSSSTIYTVPEAKRYSINKRKCIFRSETETIFGSYSYSDCIVDCKVKSIIALCQCVPFNLINVINHNEHITTCTLSDLVCLDRFCNKYNSKCPNMFQINLNSADVKNICTTSDVTELKPRLATRGRIAYLELRICQHFDKWKKLNPLDYIGDELDREKQDSLTCEHCVPACSDTLYEVRNEYSEIVTGENSNLTAEHSVLHIFFEKPYGVLNKQDVLFTWYDIVGSFGGMCSLIIGVSLISGIEFVYFFTVRFLKKYYRSNN